MRASDYRTTESQSRAASAPAQRKNSPTSAPLLSGNGQGVAEHQLHDDIERSPVVQQFRNYQEMADNSRQVKQLQSYQAMADHGVSNRVSQAGENATIQAKKVVQLTGAVVQREPIVTLHDGKAVDLGPMKAEELQVLIDYNRHKEDADKETIIKELERKKNLPGIGARAIGAGAAGLKTLAAAKKMAGHKDTDSAAAAELINHDEERQAQAEEMAAGGAKSLVSAAAGVVTGGISGLVKSGAGAVSKAGQAAAVLKIKSDAEKRKAAGKDAAHNEVETAAAESECPAELSAAFSAVAKDLGAKGAGAALSAIPVAGSILGPAASSATDASAEIEIVKKHAEDGNAAAAAALEAIRPPEDRLDEAVRRGGAAPIGAGGDGKRTTYGTFGL